jgi:hypothetical protein
VTPILILAGLGFIISTLAFLDKLLDYGDFGDAAGAALQALVVYILTLAIGAVAVWILWKAITYVVEYIESNALTFLVLGIFTLIALVSRYLSYLARMVKGITGQNSNANQTDDKANLNGEIHQEEEQKKKARRRAGYVYLVRSPTGYYKIGRTKNPKDRIQTFKVKLPFEVEYEALIPTKDMYSLEKELHDQFAHKRGEGEWFELNQENVAYIKSLEKLQENVTARHYD